MVDIITTGVLKKLIKDYLKLISKTNIEFVEIGFFTIKKNNNLGLTANINKKFFRNFKIPKKIKIGIMINVSLNFCHFKNSEDLKERLDEIDYKYNLYQISLPFK